MKILQIISTYKPAYIYGGPIMSVSKLCEALSKRKDVSLKLITTNANGVNDLPITVGENVTVDGVPVIYFKRLTGDPHETSPQLWYYLIKNAKKYDIIHIHAWWNLIAVLSAFVCVIKGKKVIISPRGMLSEYIFETNNNRQKIFLHKFIGKRLLSRSYYHATSDQEYIECKNLINGWKGFNIPNIVELPLIPIVKRNKGIFTIGFLSRIDPKKGIEFIFEAIQKLPFPVCFKIAGKGNDNYIIELKQLAEKLQVANKIEWLGWKGPEDKFYELMNFDLFVLSSFNENFANVVVEALYMGTPVCISQHVGLASFVEKQELGWITDLTVPSLGQAISDAYFDNAKRKKIEETGRSIILSEFSEEVVIQQYINMYNTVLKSEF